MKRLVQSAAPWEKNLKSCCHRHVPLLILRVRRRGQIQFEVRIIEVLEEKYFWNRIVAIILSRASLAIKGWRWRRRDDSESGAADFITVTYVCKKLVVENNGSLLLYSNLKVRPTPPYWAGITSVFYKRLVIVSSVEWAPPQDKRKSGVHPFWVSSKNAHSY